MGTDDIDCRGSNVSVNKFKVIVNENLPLLPNKQGSWKSPGPKGRFDTKIFVPSGAVS